MKRWLELNDSSGRIIAAIAALTIVVPAVMEAGSRLLGGANGPAQVLHRLGGVSLAAGGVLLALFALLVVAEQVQDARFDRAYRRQRRRKVRLPGGGHECQYCGNRQVPARDRQCPVCGRRLE